MVELNCDSRLATGGHRPGPARSKSRESEAKVAPRLCSRQMTEAAEGFIENHSKSRSTIEEKTYALTLPAKLRVLRELYSHQIVMNQNDGPRYATNTGVLNSKAPI